MSRSSTYFALLFALCILSQELTGCMASKMPYLELQILQSYGGDKVPALKIPSIIPDAKTRDATTKAVDAVSKVASTMSTFFDKVSGIQSMVKVLSTLGPAFAGVGLIFTVMGLFGPAEPDKTQLLMNQISSMEAKLGSQIDKKFDELTMRNLKAGFADVEAKIQNSANILAELNRARVVNDAVGYNFQVNEFKVSQADTQYQLNRIMMAFQETSSYGAALPTQFSQLTNGDEEAVMAVVKSLIILFTKAQINFSAYVNLVSPESADYVASQITLKNNVVQNYLSTIPAIVAADTRGYLQSSKTYDNIIKTSGCSGYSGCNDEILRQLNSKYGKRLYFTVGQIENTSGKNYATIRGFNSAWIQLDRFILIFWIPKDQPSCKLDWQRTDQWNIVKSNFNRYGTLSAFSGVNFQQGMLAYWDDRDRWGTNHWFGSNYPGNPGLGRDGKYVYWGVGLSQDCAY